MIRIEIEAPTYELLLVKVAEAVGITISGKVLSDGPPVSKPVTHTVPWYPLPGVILKDPAFVSPTGEPELRDATPAGPVVGITSGVTAGETAPISQDAPRRGRPRKQQNAQPAVAENTGSTAAVATLPVPPPEAVVAEQASTSVAGEAVPAAAPVTSSITYTAEQVRAKLQEFLVTPGGDRGLQLAGDVLAQFGLAKVKQVNDNPQHFAGIVAAVDAELAKLAVAK